MTGNYQSVPRVWFQEYSEAVDDPDPVYEASARIDELYYDNGLLELRLQAEHGDKSWSVSIPVLKEHGWNGFVNDLPTWDYDNDE